MTRKSLVLALALLSGGPVFAQDSAPTTFRIKDIKTNGDACMPGTTAVNISEDREAFTVTFADFVAERGPDALNGNRRICRLVFDTEQQANWEYAIVGVTIRGFAQLDPGVTGRQEIQFGKKGNEAESVLELKGPFAEDYIHTEEIPFDNLRWSGCKPKSELRVKDFIVKATAIVRSKDPQASGILTVDSADGQLTQVYDLAWRRCGERGPRFEAICELTGANGRTLLTRGIGNRAEVAQEKAQNHLNQRCSQVKAAFGACDAAAAQCSIQTL